MKDNQFTHWTTQELMDWVEKFNFHSLLTINNVNTYLQALQELGRRVNEMGVSK